MPDQLYHSRTTPTASRVGTAKVGKLRAVLAAAASGTFALVAFSQALAGQRVPFPEQYILATFRDPSVKIAKFVVKGTGNQGMGLKLADPAAAYDAAQQNLRRFPLDTSALLLMGIAADQRGHADAAARLGALIDKTSIRNAGGQFWLAELALRRNAYDDVLKHLDRALRTKPATAAQIFPAMSEGLRNYEFRGLLADSMRRNPPWQADFLAYSSANPKLAVPLARLIAQIAPLKDSESARLAGAQLTAALADSGETGLLRSIYARFPGEADFGASLGKSGGFLIMEGYAPVSWDIAAAASHGGAVFRRTGSDKLDLNGWSSQDIKATALRKILWLRPGTWQLDWFEMGQDAGSGAEAHMSVRCAALQVPTPLAATGNLFLARQARSLRFTVTPRCSAVMLELAVKAGEGDSMAQVDLKDVGLRQVGS